MIILGIESSCDETGTAVYCTERGLLSQALHSQADMHRRYGGVVPELASRDHVARLLPLIETVLEGADIGRGELQGIAYTAGPGLAGALLVGAATASALGFALRIPTIGVHHLEGHLLSPLLADPAPRFPFVALLASGGHTQLLEVRGLGDYQLLGDTLDDAAGEAFDKGAKLLSLPYPGGPELARLATGGKPGRFKLPRPMLRSADLDFSFSGLKTAVLTQVRRGLPDEQARADLAAELQQAIVDVLAAKALAAVRTLGAARLVVAGGVSANQALRARLEAAAADDGFELYFPPPALCTDNGAMIALAGALRLATDQGVRPSHWDFRVRPRWALERIDLQQEEVAIRS